MSYNFDDEIKLSEEGFLSFNLVLNLLTLLLDTDVQSRITADQAASHKWIEKFMNFIETVSPMIKGRSQKPNRIQINMMNLLLYLIPFTLETRKKSIHSQNLRQ